MEKREIKFRGKRIDNNEWCYGNLINWHPHLNPRIIWREEIGESAEELDFNETNFEVTIESVSQYTGLKDKNGKEIYEGDNTNIGTVVFLGGAFWHELNNSTEVFLLIEVSEYIKIIGNIYENN